MISDTAASALRIARQVWCNVCEVFFPPVCVVCGSPRSDSSQWLCEPCRSHLVTNAASRPRCLRCSLNPSIRSCTCEFTWDHPFDRIVSVFDYDETVRRLMHFVKYRGMSRLGFDLGREFAQYLPADTWEGVEYVVPVPLHLWRCLRRGYNQADCIARGFVAGIDGRPGLCYLNHAVQRRRATRTQTKLDREQRLANLRGAFVIPPDIAEREFAGRGVLLVDDVVTTGATTGACAEAILKAGARFVRVASLARD